MKAKGDFGNVDVKKRFDKSFPPGAIWDQGFDLFPLWHHHHPNLAQLASRQSHMRKATLRARTKTFLTVRWANLDISFDFIIPSSLFKSVSDIFYCLTHNFAAESVGHGHGHVGSFDHEHGPTCVHSPAQISPWNILPWDEIEKSFESEPLEIEHPTMTSNCNTITDWETALQNGTLDVNTLDELGYNGFHYAVRRGNLNLVKFLEAKNADLFKNTEDSVGDTCLHLALRSGDMSMLSYLMDKGLRVAWGSYPQIPQCGYQCGCKYGCWITDAHCEGRGSKRTLSNFRKRQGCESKGERQ